MKHILYYSCEKQIRVNEFTYKFRGASQMVLVVKNLPDNSGDLRDVSLISGSGRSPGEGNGNLLQYSCLEKSMYRENWQVAKS